MPARDPSLSEVMSFELREASFERPRLKPRAWPPGFSFSKLGTRNSLLESLPRLGSEREQARYSLRSPLRGRTPCVTPLRYVPTAWYSKCLPMQKARPAYWAGLFTSGVRHQASCVLRPSIRQMTYPEWDMGEWWGWAIFPIVVSQRGNRLPRQEVPVANRRRAHHG